MTSELGVVSREPEAGSGVLCSVIVPAHNEAAILGDRLGALTRAGDSPDIELVVVTNGCTDDTASVARGLRGAHVLELAEASKAAALNAGDRYAHHYPRIYLDADVRLSVDALRSLASALTTDRAVIAAPSVTFDVTGASWPVRAFFSVFGRLPYTTEGLVGLGVYGMSENGRRRFTEFPDVVADDLFVQRLFAADERVTVDASFEVVVPRNLRGLLAIRTRAARGNRELAERSDELALDGSSTTSGTARALVSLGRRTPRLLPALLVYVLVTAAARARAARSPADAPWERDQTSRRAATPVSPERITVDGVDFDPLTEEQVVDRVMTELVAGRGGRIITPNVDIHRQLRRSEHAALLDAAELVVPDGMPIIWASRLQGQPLPQRVAGATLVWALARGAAEHDRSLFILGAAPGVAEQAGQRLVAAAPGLRLAGHHSPPFSAEFSAAELDRIGDVLQKAAPDVVLVALGFPKQERLMADLHRRFPGTWFIGCGGSADLIAGRTTRAPLVVQRLGLEWVFRLAQEPRRLFRRYVIDDIPHAVGMLGRATAARRARSGGGAR